jgi:hypothetical protein
MTTKLNGKLVIYVAFVLVCGMSGSAEAGCLKKTNLSATGCLLLDSAKFGVSYGFTNQASASGDLGLPLPPVEITNSETYKFGVTISDKPIFKQLLEKFFVHEDIDERIVALRPDKVMNTNKKFSLESDFLYEFFVVPIKFTAGVNQQRVLKTSGGAITTGLTNTTVYEVGIAYKLSMDTVGEHLGRTALFGFLRK